MSHTPLTVLLPPGYDCVAVYGCGLQSLSKRKFDSAVWLTSAPFASNFRSTVSHWIPLQILVWRWVYKIHANRITHLDTKAPYQVSLYHFSEDKWRGCLDSFTVSLHSPKWLSLHQRMVYVTRLGVCSSARDVQPAAFVFGWPSWDIAVWWGSPSVSMGPDTRTWRLDVIQIVCKFCLAWHTEDLNPACRRVTTRALSISMTQSGIILGGGGGGTSPQPEYQIFTIMTQQEFVWHLKTQQKRGSKGQLRLKSRFRTPKNWRSTIFTQTISNMTTGTTSGHNCCITSSELA